MINKIQPTSPSSYTNGVHRIEGKPDIAPAKSQGGTAQVTLSGDALALQRATQAVKETPDVRVEVVKAIRAQLEAGTYRVNVEGLAEKLLPLLN